METCGQQEKVCGGGWNERKEYDISRKLQTFPAVATDKCRHLARILQRFFKAGLLET